MSIITSQLRSNEKILWQGNPVLKPFVFATNFYPLVFGLLFIIFVSVFFIFPVVSEGAPLEFTLFLVPIYLIGFGLSFGMPIWSLLTYKNTEYIISDQRIITQTGAVGIDLRIVDLEKIQEVNVRIGFVDRLFKTGSIYAETAGQIFSGFQQRGPGWGGSFVSRPSLASIKEPYEVKKILQEAIHQAEDAKRLNRP
jgi:uncharacterized membrane protein YdbT with pleckstrin-like domain